MLCHHQLQQPLPASLLLPLHQFAAAPPHPAQSHIHNHTSSKHACSLARGPVQSRGRIPEIQCWGQTHHSAEALCSSGAPSAARPYLATSVACLHDRHGAGGRLITQRCSAAHGGSTGHDMTACLLPVHMQAALGHPYVIKPSAGRVGSWVACGALGAIIGCCAINPDGGDYGVWLPQVRMTAPLTTAAGATVRAEWLQVQQQLACVCLCPTRPLELETKPPAQTHPATYPCRSSPSSTATSPPLPQAAASCRCSGHSSPTGCRSTSTQAWRSGSQVGAGMGLHEAG